MDDEGEEKELIDGKPFNICTFDQPFMISSSAEPVVHLTNRPMMLKVARSDTATKPGVSMVNLLTNTDYQGPSPYQEA